MTERQVYGLTAHAKEVTEARGIRPVWLEQVVTHPQKSEPDRTDKTLTHHLGKITEYDGRVLRVVLSKRTKTPLIVTAYFDRTLKGKL